MFHKSLFCITKSISLFLFNCSPQYHYMCVCGPSCFIIFVTSQYVLLCSLCLLMGHGAGTGNSGELEDGCVGSGWVCNNVSYGDTGVDREVGVGTSFFILSCILVWYWVLIWGWVPLFFRYPGNTFSIGY